MTTFETKQPFDGKDSMSMRTIFGIHLGDL